MKRILLLGLALVALFHTAANAQHPWEMTCSTTSISVQAPNSVAIGETFDIVVTITNTGSGPVYDFKSMVGYIDPGYNNPPAPPSSFLDHFIMLDVHTSRGESDLWYIDRYNQNTEEYEYFSYIDWDLDEDWKRQWLLPGESATLRITLRSVGVPGTYNFPAAINHYYYDENNYDDVVLDCPNSVAMATINITPGTISEPLLIAKPIMAPNFYDCVPMGSSLSAVWQVRNTSDETIWVRLQDVIPGKSFVYLNDILITSAENGTQGFWGIINYSVDKSTGNGTIGTDWPIGLSPGQMLVIVGRMEASKFSQPFEFVSPVKVWLTEENDENNMNIPPNDAIEFFNEPLSVCDPIVTKTTVGTYCNVLEGTIIEYEVSVERIFFDNSTAYLIFKDEHPAGTSYMPFTTVGNAEETYTIYGDPQTTYWVFNDNYVDDLDEDAYEASYEHEDEVFTEPDHDDHIVLRYRVRVDSHPQGDLVNKFSIYSGNRDYNYSYFDDKIVAKTASENRSARARGRDVEPPKQATSFNGMTMLYSYLEEATLASKVIHTIKEDCFFIDGYKFNDLNGNGRRDTGEPGVESWMITAQSSVGTYTAVTDADGYYRIDNLPKGVWQVREAYQLGWIQSAPGGEGFYNVSISDQVKSARLDFGNWKFAEISGIKYHDLNGSGMQDDGEPGVEGVLIELRDLSGEVQTTTYTDGAGRYGFAQVPPGHFVVYEEANPKWRQSQPGPAEGGYHYVVTTSGSIHTKKDFGNYEPVTISGSVAQVNNKSAEHDPTVRDFRDLKIQLQRMGPTGDPTPQKTADASEPMILDLDENGAFEASGLQPGDWQASVVLAEFWSAVSSNPVDVFVPSGDEADIGFEVYFDGLAAPEQRLSSITGTVYRNTTADHLYNPGTDVKVAGHTVSLAGMSTRGAAVERTATTDGDGIYRFTELPAGNYTVSLGGVDDSLKTGWPWADAHRVILGDDEHVGATFDDMQIDLLNYDLAWLAQSWSAYANLWMRIDDDGDGHADRRNFFSGGANLARTSTNGTWPMVVAHTSLQMAGTDSLGRTIRAIGPSGGSLANLGPGAGAPGNGGTLMTTWTQGLDLNLDLADGLWYGPTASSLSNEPAVVATASIGRWLSVYTSAEFVAQAGSVPVLRDPTGTPVARVLSASYVFTPGPDFGLTPKRFDAADDGDDDDDGTGSGSGGIGTSDPGDGANLPSDFALGSAYPNPFNPSTVVPFELAAAGQVQLAVYDVMGRRVSTLVNGTMSAGRHTLAWDAAGLPSGVYVIQLRAGGKQFVSKVTLLK